MIQLSLIGNAFCLFVFGNVCAIFWETLWARIGSIIVAIVLAALEILPQSMNLQQFLMLVGTDMMIFSGAFVRSSLTNKSLRALSVGLVAMVIYSQYFLFELLK